MYDYAAVGALCDVNGQPVPKVKVGRNAEWRDGERLC